MRNTLEPCGACVNHDDTNLTNKQENCALTVSVFMCRCVEFVLGLGGHVVIGVVHDFTTQT